MPRVDITLIGGQRFVGKVHIQTVNKIPRKYKLIKNMYNDKRWFYGPWVKWQPSWKYAEWTSSSIETNPV